jgi:hypothetical protein
MGVDGDGRADIYNDADSVHSAANCHRRRRWAATVLSTQRLRRWSGNPELPPVTNQRVSKILLRADEYR